MIPEYTTAQRIEQMVEQARFYQQRLLQAIGIQVRRKGRDSHESLVLALHTIINWLQQFDNATEMERQSPEMYTNWLQTVCGAASIYDDWSSQYLQEKWFGQVAQEAPEVRAG